MDAGTAKQFLISKVIEQAESEHVQLSDVEKKMLYFTEVNPSLPDIYEVNAEFERDYDTDKYEDKIIGLLERARTHDAAQSAQYEGMWADAISALKQEDHYILVMVYRAFPEYRKSLRPTHRVRDYVIYIAVGTAVVLLSIGIAILSH
jgi:hypothetical protein